MSFLLFLVVGFVAAAQAENCEYFNPKSCLNQFFEDKPCEFDFPQQLCLNSTQVNDVCQGYDTEAVCNNNGCLFDPYLKTCLASLAQINSVYDCAYWSGYATQTANEACLFHGCLYDSVIRQCVVANATLTPRPNAPPINAQVRFVNPTFRVANQEFSVQAVTPFVYTQQTPTRPEFPIFAVLFAVSEPQFYASQPNAKCSTFQPSQYQPSSFTTTANPEAVQQYFTEFVNTNSTLNFDNSAFGQYDNGNLVFNLTVSMLNATSFCSQQGASAVDDENGRTYTLPLSYIEHSTNNLYVQVVQTYKINVPLTGVVTIGAQTTYGTGAYPQLIRYTKGPVVGCGDDEGRINIQFQVDTYNVYDPSIRVGVFTPNDISFRSPSTVGPVNCYGDQLDPSSALFGSVTCDYSNFVCSQQFTIRSKCRALNTEGNSFNECRFAFAQDRIADMNGDFPYPTSLNALHTVFFQRRACPLSQGQVETCPFVTPSAESVSAVIQGSSFLDASTTVDGFFVQSGFLDTPVADLTNALVLQSSNETIIIQEASLITLAAVMQLASRSTYSLRTKIQNAETRIVPLNENNIPLSATTNYNGKALLTYNDFRSSLLYVTKTQFDQGCGIEDSCLSLPACQGVLGCDGFSLPASSLLRLMPAPRYSITMSYSVVLPQTQPAPASRRLLQSNGFDRRDTFVIEVQPTFVNTTITTNNTTCEAQNQTNSVVYCQALLRAVLPMQEVRPIASKTIGPLIGTAALLYFAVFSLSFCVANKIK